MRYTNNPTTRVATPTEYDKEVSKGTVLQPGESILILGDAATPASIVLGTGRPLLEAVRITPAEWDALIPSFQALEDEVQALSDNIDNGLTKAVSTRAALKVLATDSGPYRLLESGREGTFYWDAIVPHEKHSLDTAEGIYVAPNPAVDGAWVRDWTRRGYVTAPEFGATPNGNSGPALESMVDFCGPLQIPMKLPSPGENSGGGTGRYLCDRFLSLYDNMILFADHNVVLRFDNHTHGFVADEASNGITSGFRLYGFAIEGVAHTAANATETHGLHLLRCRDFYIDIDVKRFVVNRYEDAQDVGHISGHFQGEYFQSDFPNPNNGYPKANVKLTGVSKKPQIITTHRFKVYAQILAKEVQGTIPAGKNVPFTIPAPLYRGSGIIVYAVDSNGYKTQTTDFTLYDETGVQTALTVDYSNDLLDYKNPGDPSVAAVTTPTSLSVTFGASHAEGDSYEILWSDPTGEVGIDIEKASGVDLSPDAVGGYAVGIKLTDVKQSRINPLYAQLCKVFCDADDVNWIECYPREWNNTITTRYVTTANTKNFKVDPFEGQFKAASIPFEVLGDGSTDGNSYHEVNGTSSRVTAEGEYPTKLLVRATLSSELIAPSNTTGAMYFRIVAYDNEDTTPRVVSEARVLIADATSQNSYSVEGYDTVVLDQSGGIPDYREYALEMQTSRAGDQIEADSWSSQNSILSVTRVAAYT